MKKKNGPSGTVDEVPPNASLASSYVMSKPWKESRTVRNWVPEQGPDPLFKVCTHVFHINR